MTILKDVKRYSFNRFNSDPRRRHCLITNNNKKLFRRGAIGNIPKYITRKFMNFAYDCITTPQIKDDFTSYVLHLS